MAEARAAAFPRRVVDADPFGYAAEALGAALLEALETRPRVRLAIPGGSALQAVPAARDALGDAWHRVMLTWVDERCVPVGDAQSNRGAAARLGLLAARPASVLPLFEDDETPAEAVARVTARLAADFSNALDVVLLGMGADGHVASLFPQHPVLAQVREQGLVAHVADSPKPPLSRITLTRAAIATAQRVVLVAAGASKQHALRRLMAGDPGLPASGLEGLVIVTDLEGPETGGD